MEGNISQYLDRDITQYLEGDINQYLEEHITQYMEEETWRETLLERKTLHSTWMET